MTITPPDPAMLPAAIKESKSMATSTSSAVKILAEIPPGMTALSLFPSRMPPAFSINSFRVTLTGSS